MQSLKVYRDYAAEQALALFFWFLCHDSVCVSAGALSVSQCIGERWMPGWRLVTWISLSHSSITFFFFFSFLLQFFYVFARVLRSWTFGNFSVLYMKCCDQSLYGRHPWGSSALCQKPYVGFLLLFVAKFWKEVSDICGSDSKSFFIANLVTAHLALWTALATDCYSFGMN